MFSSHSDIFFTGYVVVFGLAALASFLSIRVSQRIQHTEIRRGLTALLLTTGGWAAAHVGYLLAPSSQLRYAFFVAGLVIGLAAVGPWLYFCSAYTGRTLHRNRRIRQVAVGLFLAIVLVKITNPLHGQYFVAEVASSPFDHLLIHHQPLHWVAMGLAYSLAFIGFFMLFELFSQVDYETGPLFAVVGLTGLPVLFDILGATTPVLLDMTYSPIGVVAFSIGFLYVYLHRFQTVRLTSDSNQPAIVVDADGRIRDTNTPAKELFPALVERLEEPLADVVPKIASRIEESETDDGTETILPLTRSGTTDYYSVTTHPFMADRTDLGRVITLRNVTDRERYRTELERQNDRLDQFAGMVSHDLRNPLNVATLRIEQAEQECDSDALPAAASALERMEELITDLLMLARHGQPLDETESVQLSSVANQCWGMVETPDASIRVDDDLTFQADPDRLQQLFENLFRNSVEHAGPAVTVTVGPLESESGFYVTDDGPGIPTENLDEVFESGFTTAEDGTGFGLAIIKEIAQAHGWTVRLSNDPDGGARFEFLSVQRE